MGGGRILIHSVYQISIFRGRSSSAPTGLTLKGGCEWGLGGRWI